VKVGFVIKSSESATLGLEEMFWKGWVENGVYRSEGASDCGAEHSFVVLFGFHLGFTIFPFPVSTAQIIG
jgi:hypothetical protein